MSKEQYLNSGIEWMEKHGFSNIKANHEDYETPISFNQQSSEKSYTPDITGMKTGGGKSFAEIALKTDNVTKRVTKWILLSTMAARKGGKLYLLAPRGHKSFAADIVTQYNLDAKVVSI